MFVCLDAQLVELRQFELSITRMVTCLASDLEDRLGKTLDISRCDASNRNSTVLGRVDGMFLCQLVHLF